MKALHALGAFSGGVALIAGAIAFTWEFWVVYGGYPRGALSGNSVANGFVSGPAVALGGLAMIVWGFTLQPVVAGIACVVTVPVALIILRRAYRRTKRAHANPRT